jgi:hypothetical protein
MGIEKCIFFQFMGGIGIVLPPNGDHCGDKVVSGLFATFEIGDQWG